MYHCGNYPKVPVGTLCKSAHRIKADYVMEIVAKTIKEVIRYANLDKERFAGEIQSHIEDRQTVDFSEQRKRMNVCEKRIGEYIPPTMAKKEPMSEELEEMRKKEARKAKLHQNYLKWKANGKQKEYEERTKAKKKAQIESQKEQIRAENREKGIYFHAGVPNIPRAGKQAVM